MGKIKLLIFVLICFLGPNLAYAWDIKKDNPFFGLEKYAKEMKRNVFALQTEGDLTNEEEKDDYILLGSGFLIQKNNYIVGITCKHLILKYLVIEEGEIKVENGEIVLNRSLYMGLDTDQGYKRFRVKLAHVNESYDFVLLFPQKDKPEDKIALKNLVLKDTYLGDNTLIAEGKGILVTGYPLSLGLEYNKNFPVVNFGIISQYKNQENFLIDGSINRGNSGSPVFSLKDEKIIGMITSYRNAQIPLFDENNKLVATLPYNSGLANALPVGVIKRTLDELIKSTQK